MTSTKKFAGCVFAGAAASILMVSSAQAGPTLQVNDEMPLTASAFSYVPSGTNGSTASVTTDGFLFCANVGPTQPNFTAVKLAPAHARWTLPTAMDVQAFAYSGGLIRINKPVAAQSAESTLICHARGAQGTVSSPFSAYSDWVFADGLESFAGVQFGNLVNWIPPQEFSWEQPDWSQVPTDACNFDQSSTDVPRTPESALCAAATGVRAITGNATGQRAPTMWTATSGGSSFIYLARIDARLGPQVAGPNMNFGLPASANSSESPPNAVNVEIRDGFDSQYLTPTGSWCFLMTLPATLGTGVCNGAIAGGTLGGTGQGQDGTLRTSIPLSLFPSSPAASFYVAVIRSINPANPPTIDTPVAAIAVMTDPGTIRHDNGDEFTGDDVVFGFPNSGGFSWMGL